MASLKFRAYNSDKGMVYIDDLYWFEENGVRDSSGDGLFQDWEIMQHTGLTDIHDRPIYEGDLVEFETGDIEEVCFDPPEFKAGERSLKNCRVQVVGSIYESARNSDGFVEIECTIIGESVESSG